MSSIPKNIYVVFSCGHWSVFKLVNVRVFLLPRALNRPTINWQIHTVVWNSCIFPLSIWRFLTVLALVTNFVLELNCLSKYRKNWQRNLDFFISDAGSWENAVLYLMPQFVIWNKTVPPSFVEIYTNKGKVILTSVSVFMGKKIRLTVIKRLFFALDYTRYLQCPLWYFHLRHQSWQRTRSLLPWCL